jgi:hypothetical protein
MHAAQYTLSFAGICYTISAEYRTALKTLHSYTFQVSAAVTVTVTASMLFPGDVFYVIEEGTFTIFDNSGKELARVSKGSCFGELALMHQASSLIHLIPCEFISISSVLPHIKILFAAQLSEDVRMPHIVL